MRENIPAADELLGRYFPVLDHGFVALTDYMGGDLSVERFARGSYSVADEDRTIKQTRGLIRYLLRHHHSSPLESVELVFHIGLPIFVARQLIRHRTASLNEYSGRYSPIPMIFYSPENDQVCFQSDSNKQGRAIPVGEEIFNEFTWDNSWTNRERIKDSYRWAIDQGIARETARMDLPLSTYTYMYWKMDLHNLMHFIGLRSDSHAQWEIQEYSDVFAGIMKAVAPICFEAFIDYKYGAVTFTRMEMLALLDMYNDGDSREDELIDALFKYGVDDKREQREFLGKMSPRALKTFDLDSTRAKDPKFFFDKVKANL